MQLVESIAPEEGVEKPAGHVEHEVEEALGAYEPTGHRAHGGSPLDDEEPAGHAAVQREGVGAPLAIVEVPVGHRAQEVRAISVWYVPIGQSEHGRSPVDETEPAGHPACEVI